MKHQPYEDWVFSQEDLDLDQRKELQVHLKLCERCNFLASTLADAEKNLFSEAMISPEFGFTSRWRARLEKRKQDSFKRQTSLLFGVLSIGAAILFIPVILYVITNVLSPGDIFTEFLQNFVDWLAVIGFTTDVIAGVIDGMADTIPLGWWLTFASALLGLFSLWIIMLLRIQPKPQAVNGS